MSQFIAEMTAPIFGDFGDGEIGAALSGDENGSNFRLTGDVRFSPLADSPYVAFDVAFGGKADMSLCAAHVCFPKRTLPVRAVVR